MKLATITLIIAVIIMAGCFWYVKYSTPEISTSSISNVRSVSYPVFVSVDRWNVLPTTVDTVKIDGHEYKLARYAESIAKNKVRVDLDIAYSELSGLFDVRAGITSQVDSVIVEKIITNIVTKKPPFIALIGSLTPVGSIDLKTSPALALDHLNVGFGARIADKCDVELIGGSDLSVGCRIGIRF